MVKGVLPPMVNEVLSRQARGGDVRVSTFVERSVQRKLPHIGVLEISPRAVLEEVPARGRP